MRFIAIILFLIITAVLCGKAYNFISTFIDAIYSKNVIIDSMDKVIRLLKYQKVILTEVNIPFSINMSRSLFNENIKEAYYTMEQAFLNDYDKMSTRLKENYKNAQIERFKDNLNAINLALMDYEISNVRYSYDLDNLFIIGKYMRRYPFIDGVEYKKDNGLENTSALYGGIYEFYG